MDCSPSSHPLTLPWECLTHEINDFDELNDFSYKMNEIRDQIDAYLCQTTDVDEPTFFETIQRVVTIGDQRLAQSFPPSGDEEFTIEDVKEFIAYNTNYLRDYLPLTDQALSEIYWAIPEDLNKKIPAFPNRKPSEMVDAQMTAPYNRYEDIRPYKFNQVKLSSNEYIEMSDMKIDGKRYLVGSAPTRFTAPRWWQAILEHKVKLIVMTTNMNESSREKCTNYFTSASKVNQCFSLVSGWECESVRTQQNGQEGKEAIFSRIIRLTGPKGVKRKIVHLQYLNWPDHGIASPGLFLKFQDLIAAKEKTMNTSEHPPLFHCSAGCGRTGTTLAAHLLIRKLERGEPISIDLMIARLRSQRPHMVQSGGQYQMIAEAVCLLQDGKKDRHVE